MEKTMDWQFLISTGLTLMQVTVVPMIIWIWQHEKRLNETEKNHIKTFTMMDEREKARLVIRAAEAETLENLRKSIGILNDKLDTLEKVIARMQGYDDKERSK